MAASREQGGHPWQVSMNEASESLEQELRQPPGLAAAAADPLLDAAAIQSLGSVISTKIVPVSAAATFAGGAPVRMRRIALVPIVASIASSLAFRSATEN